MVLSAIPQEVILSYDRRYHHASTPPPRHLRPRLGNHRPHLSGGPGKVGRPAEDNRPFINAVFWLLRTGAPWRDLPPNYGHWNTTARRFRALAEEWPVGRTAGRRVR